MKLASFREDNRESYGAVIGANIVDLGRALGGRYRDLRSLIAEGGLPAAAQIVHATPADIPACDVGWRPVIPNPDKIICVGLNYKAHIREVGRKIEDQPVLFLRLPSSHVGHLQPIVRPKVSEQFDYEGELAVIIGRDGRHIPAGRAFDHVAGYSIYNDGSVRDWQRHTHQYTPGKNFLASGAFGPWMATADEIPHPAELRLTTRLNAEIVQDAYVSDLLFTIDQLIAYASTFTPLVAGDVIVTGTPSGVGAARKPPLWMRPGDVVEVSVDVIGTLRNPVVQES